MAKKEKIRITIQPHESKRQWMNRCGKDKVVISNAKHTAKQSPYPLDWIIENICEIKWKSTHPIKTYGPKPKPPKEPFKGTIFSFPSY